MAVNYAKVNLHDLLTAYTKPLPPVQCKPPHPPSHHSFSTFSLFNTTLSQGRAAVKSLGIGGTTQKMDVSGGGGSNSKEEEEEENADQQEIYCSLHRRLGTFLYGNSLHSKYKRQCSRMFFTTQYSYHPVMAQK